MKLSKSLTKVTWFSRILALLLILAFIGAAFFAGIMFQRKVSEVASLLTPMPTPMPANQVSCTTDSDCVLTTEDTKNSCCPNTRCLNFADESTIAVSKSWFDANKQAVCGGTRYMCPMIAIVCSKTIIQENTRYNAKCISHVCQKVRS